MEASLAEHVNIDARVAALFWRIYSENNSDRKVSGSVIEKVQETVCDVFLESKPCPQCSAVQCNLAPVMADLSDIDPLVEGAIRSARKITAWRRNTSAIISGGSLRLMQRREFKRRFSWTARWVWNAICNSSSSSFLEVCEKDMQWRHLSTHQYLTSSSNTVYLPLRTGLVITMIV